MKRLLLCALTAGYLLSTPAVGQVFNYVAMGDSITAGSFDEQNKGGYPGRLDTKLGCNGGASSCQIYNEGIGGNTTAQMLSRINGVLNARPYDVMLLMGGTNDIFKNISNATIEFNLEEMYGRATSRGIDTVFASIIWFHPNGVHGSSKNSTVSNLRDRVTSLANARSGYLVDNWKVLCPSPAGNCFSVDYYQCIAPLPSKLPPFCSGMVYDPVGHPDASGYDIMAGQFEGELLQEALPGAPTPTSPSGTVGGSPATYSWDREPGNRATWYELEIDGPGTHSAWYEAKGNCASSKCSVTPGVNLSEGSHSFRVRGRTPRGRSGWSNSLNFSIQVPPPAPVASAPFGPVYVPPVQIQFEWMAAAGATQYEIEIRDSAEVVFHDQTFNATTACSGTACQATASWNFSAGSYGWHARSINAAGPGLWNGWKSFTVVDSPPQASVPGYPDREIFNTNPLHIWSVTPFTTYYSVEVYAAGGAKKADVTFDPATACSAQLCTGRTGVVLTPGQYTWRIVSGNPIGETVSTLRPFSVLPCTPETETLVNVKVMSAEVLEIAACKTIDGQNLEVNDGGVATLHAGREIRFGSGFSVLSGGTLTTIVDP